MPYRDLDREILDLNCPSGPIPQEVALDYFTGLLKVAGEPIQVPEAGTEPAEDVLAREEALSLAQAQAELQRTSEKAEQLQSQLLEAQTAAENAQATTDQSLEMAGQAREAAEAATASAAAQADGKMRLSMRINQMRQQLADIVSSDPVAEEGVGTAAVAGPGSPQTAAQQEQEAQMAEEEAMAQQAQAAPAGGKAAKEVNQAQRAQGEAAKQTAQAENAVVKSAGSGEATQESTLDRWGRVYSPAHKKKQVGIYGGSGLLGGGALGAIAGKLIKGNKGALVGGVLAGLGGTAIGARQGFKRVSKDRREVLNPVARAAAATVIRSQGATPVAIRASSRTGKIMVLGRKAGGYSTYTFAPPKVAAQRGGEEGSVARWRKVYGPDYAKKIVGGSSAAGLLGGGAIGVAKGLQKGPKGALVGGLLGALGGTAIGGVAGGTAVGYQRAKSIHPASLEAERYVRARGGRPWAVKSNVRTGKINVLASGPRGRSAYVFNPKTAGETPSGSGRVQAYLERTVAVDARLRNLLDGAYLAKKPIQPESPGGVIEEAINATNADLVQGSIDGNPGTNEMIETSTKGFRNDPAQVKTFLEGPIKTAFLKEYTKGELTDSSYMGRRFGTGAAFAGAVSGATIGTLLSKAGKSGRGALIGAGIGAIASGASGYRIGSNAANQMKGNPDLLRKYLSWQKEAIADERSRQTKMASGSSTCIETKIKDALRNNPKGQRSKSLQDLISATRFTTSRASQ